MSFSKAKIQRFNDIKDCTPSPAKYNVALKDRIKLGIISKPGLIQKSQSIDRVCVHSTPCFQTPTAPPKRKKMLGAAPKSAKKLEKSSEDEIKEKEQNTQDNQDINERSEEISLITNFSNTRNERQVATQERSEDSQTKETNGTNNNIQINIELIKDENIENHDDSESREMLQAKIREFEKKEEQMRREKEEILRKWKESEEKLASLEEDLKVSWMQKLEEKEKESEAILKECQEISEYNIIQSEIEKNQLKKQLEGYEDVKRRNEELEEEVTNLKSEKHAYALSITTFRDTIEVLKRRLINSDRDVEQLKEELEKCEEKILNYERKCTELSTQVSECQIFNEELEMQYESTLELMQNRVKSVETDLLSKLERLKDESNKSLKDKKVFRDLYEQCREQQNLVKEAHQTIVQSNSAIEALEKKQVELEIELKGYKAKLIEVVDICRKYIKKNGKFDELGHQLEQILPEIDQGMNMIQTLEEIKHVNDFKMNSKLRKTVDKLIKELDDVKKVKKMKVSSEDKENFGSPKCLKGTQSPGPLKDKN